MNRYTNLLVLLSLILVVGCGRTESSSSRGPVFIKQIVINELDGPKTLDGWSVIESNEFQCRIAWPDDDELQNNDIYANGLEHPMLSFGTELWDQSYTIDQILDNNEKFLVGFDRLLFSEDIDVGEGIRCRAFATEDGIISMCRIYVTDKRLWIISAVSMQDNPEIDKNTLAYFFSNFKVIPPGE